MVNYQCLLGDHNYGIKCYERLEKNHLKPSYFLSTENKLNNKLTRSNPKKMHAFILLSKVLCEV